MPDSPPDPGFDVGGRLRQLRLARGLSQRELARRAGVTNSTVSLIEQNSVSPSVSSLKKLLDALPVSISTFFAGEEMLEHDGEEGGVVVAGEIEITVNGEVARLRAGDAYYFDSRLPHRFRNLGGEECVIVSANTPPSFSDGRREQHHA